MPLIVNGSSNVWWVKQKVRATNEIRDAKVLIVDGVQVWNRFDMEEKVSISAEQTQIKNNQLENIIINNITPYQITVTNVKGSLLNNGTKNIIVQGGERKLISASTSFLLGGVYY